MAHRIESDELSDRLRTDFEKRLSDLQEETRRIESALKALGPGSVMRAVGGAADTVSGQAASTASGTTSASTRKAAAKRQPKPTARKPAARKAKPAARKAKTSTRKAAHSGVAAVAPRRKTTSARPATGAKAAPKRKAPARPAAAARAPRTVVLDDTLTVKDMMRIDVLELPAERLEQLGRNRRRRSAT
jgi:hypothetical protein